MCRPGTIHKLSQLGTLITAVYQFCRSLLNFSSKSQKQHKKTRTAFRLLRSKKPQRHSRATGDNGQRVATLPLRLPNLPPPGAREGRFGGRIISANPPKPPKPPPSSSSLQYLPHLARGCRPGKLRHGRRARSAPVWVQYGRWAKGGPKGGPKGGRRGGAKGSRRRDVFQSVTLLKKYALASHFRFCVVLAALRTTYP